MKTLPIVLFAILFLGSMPAKAEDIPVKFSGDVRYRHDSLKQGDEEVDHRHRLRVRFGAVSELSEELELGLQIASGDGDPVSLNESLGEGFAKKPVNINLAYFNYKPLDGLVIVGGKIANPFFRPGESQLVWDGDLTPEGLGVSYAHQFSTVKLFATGVAFWTADRSGEESDAHILGGQAGVGWKFGDFLLVGAGALYNFTKLVGYGTLIDGSAFGNTLDAGDLYVNDYNLVDAALELRGRVRKVPFSVYGNLARNLAVDEESTAFMAGLSVGEAKGKLGWRVWYNYRVVQRDAVFGMFSDSDFGGGGTGTFGHLAGADFSVNPNLCFGLTLFLSTIDDTDQTAYNRIQLDMNVKF